MGAARTANDGDATDRRAIALAGDRLGLAVGATVIAALAGLDFVLSGYSATIAGAMLLAPFATAFFAGARATALVALAATATAILSFIWQGALLEPGQLARIAVVALGSGFAIVAATARERAGRRAERLELLDSLGDVAISADTAAVLDRIGAMLVPRVADLCVIDVVEADGGVRRLFEAADPAVGANLDRVSPPSAWIPAFAAAAGRAGPRPILIEDLDSPGDRVPDAVSERLAAARLRSALAAPLSLRGELHGSLMLAKRSGRRLSIADARFASALSGRIALVLENAGLMRELTGTAARLRSVVSQIDEAVLISDRDGRIVYVNSVAEELFDLGAEAEMVGVPRGELVARIDARSESGERIDAGVLFAPGREGDGAARLARRGKPEIWVRVRTRPMAGPTGEPDHLLTTIEDQSEVRQAAFAHSLLARTGGLLVHSTDYRETLHEVAQLVVGEFADHCSINVPGDAGVIEQVAAANVDPHRRAAAIQLRERYPVHRDDDDPIAEVLRTGVPMLFADATRLTEQASLDDAERMLLREVGNGSCLVVPMRSGERIVGVMAFNNREGGRAFGDFDLEIAVALGDRGGDAIENARLATERGRVAEILQRELLPPPLPAIEGWAVATMYRPAGEVNQVGGDFYDAFEAGGDWVVLLGDVVGRGASAASLTAEARHTLRTALLLSADPERAFELLDAGFRRRAGARLCSAVVVILEGGGEASRLRIWSAGHPLPLLVRRGTALEVGEPGPLLGIDFEPDWPQTTVELEPGDQLVLYTDGVIEARGEEERFGIGRMRATVAAASEPAEAVTAVESALRRFLPDELDDDAAMVVLQRSAELSREPQAPGLGGAFGLGPRRG